MDTRFLVETMVQKFQLDASFDDALRQTKLFFEGQALDGLDEALQQVESNHYASVSSATKLHETSISQKLDMLQQRWYAGPLKNGLWQELADRMRSNGPKGAVEAVDGSTEAIVAAMAEPRVEHDRRLGLVVGNVQSGKTANYSGVIAKALDQNYKLVIVLSGIHNNLRRQTQIRLERDLGVSDNPSAWHGLTSPEADFGTTAKRNASSIISNNARILAVVKKNKNRLENLLEFLRALDSDVVRRTPILIIDDESDQATPDSSPKGKEEASTISRLMRELWAEVVNGTYIGYTATPFANVFMNPSAEAAELYPSNFIHVMPTPDAYFGAARLFGLDADLAAVEVEAHDVLRYIPDAELDALRPAGRDAVFDAGVTPALADAIRWFIVAAAVRRVRGQHEKHSTMLIHTTHNVDPHFDLRDAVVNFLEPRRARARDGDVREFYTTFHEEIDRAPELLTGNAQEATWPRVEQEILSVMRNLRVSVDNGQADASERLDYRDEDPQTVIVIGGGTLSRGLTLEGLFVSFFTRSSNAYDTLLQMGRWFGYRSGYEDLQRIWLSSGLDEDYRFLAQVEYELRQDIDRLIRSGQAPSQIAVRVRQHPGRLQITNPNKMKHAHEVEVDFEGYPMQTYVFDVGSEEALESNRQAARGLLERISDRVAQGQRADAGESRVFTGVPVEEVERFFQDFSVHSHFGDSFAAAVAWSATKLPEKPWNVVLASGSEHGQFEAAGFTVSSVRRAPISPDEDAVKGKHINIRALMSGDDMLLDLKLLDTGPDSERSKYSRRDRTSQKAMRAAVNDGDGNGLLILYPLSPRSTPTTRSRVEMQEALRRVNPDAKFSDQPIVGVALVAPIDSRQELTSKGTFLAVTPHFQADEDVDELPTPDTEKNFTGVV
ncbi:Z1 domain-containing protein [Pseudoclavibacter sp. Z016]|uniref:Z1 domain-containing protein n=1 Tax=Pseudoclavibacter sp. Z016 TaxID=2080581 RepID=UPI000CE91660|nr:Z1 domain-containing protein [Pseudoclavibacter sp. Z016]